MMIKFSIDYRAPPSGLGQIFNSKHKMPIQPKDMILISYDGNGSPDNPHYGGHIHLRDIYENPTEIDILRQFLIDNQVESVYDSEEGYNRPDISINGHFDLDDWIKIIKSYVS
jgi:hypothetical protein